MRIELYSPRWRRDVIRLADDVFGEGYFARSRELAERPGSIMLVSQENDETLLGFTQGRLLPQGGLEDHLEERVPDIPPDIAEADRKGVLGVIQAVAVAPPARGQGIASKLLLLLHDRLVGLGADKLFITFKRGQNAARVDGIMERLGFEHWKTLPSYWQGQCDAGDFKCADRGDRCTCEALLYRKAVY